MSEPNIPAGYGNLPDNSHQARAERKKNAPPATEGKRVKQAVVRGGVKIKKDNVRKFTDIFISEDVGNVKSYIIFDVLIPTIKKTFYEIVTNSLDIALYGGRGGGKRSSAGGVSFRGNTDYSGISRRDDRDRRDRDDSRSNSIRNYDTIVFSTRGQAELVLETMDETVDKYGQVSVADMFELVDESCPYTWNNHGWVNLRNASIVRVYDGYKIKLPRPIDLRDERSVRDDR